MHSGDAQVSNGRYRNDLRQLASAFAGSKSRGPRPPCKIATTGIEASVAQSILIYTALHGAPILVAVLALVRYAARRNKVTRNAFAFWNEPAYLAR